MRRLMPDMMGLLTVTVNALKLNVFLALALVTYGLAGPHGLIADAEGGSVSSSIGVIVYPSKGQSAQQQSRDEGECYGWAKQQTGIDPVAVASAPTKEEGPAVGGGERVKGAAGGAIGGLAIGAIAGDAGKGAAIGAVAGTMVGGHKARKNKAAREQQAEQAKAGTLQHFNKAFSACMEGRGYVIK